MSVYVPSTDYFKEKTQTELCHLYAPVKRSPSALNVVTLVFSLRNYKKEKRMNETASPPGPPTSDWDSPERVKKRLIKFRERLTRFYQQYAPEKLEKIETDLDIFEHRESELMVKLIKQYGKEPEEPLNSSDDEPYVSPWTAENPRPRLGEGSRARRDRQKRGGGDRTTEEKEAEKQRGDRRTMKLKQRDERKAGGGRLPKDPREEAEACPLDFGPTRYDLPEEEAKTLLKKFGVQ